MNAQETRQLKNILDIYMMGREESNKEGYDEGYKKGREDGSKDVTSFSFQTYLNLQKDLEREIEKLKLEIEQLKKSR